MNVLSLKKMLYKSALVTAMTPFMVYAQVDQATDYLKEELTLKVNKARDAAERANYFAQMAEKRANDAKKEAQNAQSAFNQANQLLQTFTKTASAKTKEQKA